MGEVRYSINGKYFKDYGIYVSSSLGLLDALKRKPIKTYDWQEYHGESLDLTSPKFEAREIVLNCFIKGDNYQEMFDNFRNIVLSEFQKSGTQRLLVEPFGYKSLPFEVYLSDEVNIAKEFSESTSIGVFSIKLIEPNPIKKVLYLTENTLNLSYNSSKETEIFFVNGEKTTARGNVSLSGKTLANRVVSGYNFNGRNLITKLPKEKSYPATGFWEYFPLSEKLKEGETYILNGNIENVGGFISIGLNNFEGFNDYITSIPINTPFVANYEMANRTHFSIANQTGVGTSIFKSFKLEKGNKATDWSPAPEDEKYIVIAGDIDGITNLTTNATVLWEKL